MCPLETKNEMIYSRDDENTTSQVKNILCHESFAKSDFTTANEGRMYNLTFQKHVYASHNLIVHS